MTSSKKWWSQFVPLLMENICGKFHDVIINSSEVMNGGRNPPSPPPQPQKPPKKPNLIRVKVNKITLEQHISLTLNKFLPAGYLFNDFWSHSSKSVSESVSLSDSVATSTSSSSSPSSLLFCSVAVEVLGTRLIDDVEMPSTSKTFFTLPGLSSWRVLLLPIGWKLNSSSSLEKSKWIHYMIFVR